MIQTSTSPLGFQICMGRKRAVQLSLQIISSEGSKEGDGKKKKKRLSQRVEPRSKTQAPWWTVCKWSCSKQKSLRKFPTHSMTVWGLGREEVVVTGSIWPMFSESVWLSEAVCLHLTFRMGLCIVVILPLCYYCMLGVYKADNLPF